MINHLCMHRLVGQVISRDVHDSYVGVQKSLGSILPLLRHIPAIGMRGVITEGMWKGKWGKSLEDVEQL